MKRNHFISLTALIAVIFTILFYKNSIGINLLIFEWVIIPLMIYVNKPFKRSIINNTLLLSLIISSIMIVIIHTPWTIFINLILLLSFSGALSYKDFRSYIHLLIDSFVRIFTTHFSKQDLKTNKKNKTNTPSILNKTLLWVIVPLITLLIFTGLYTTASSKFAELIKPIFRSIFDFLEEINITLILIFILGIIISNILLRRSKSIGLLKVDQESSDILFRKRISHIFPFKTNALKTHYLMGVIILSILNILILIFNVTDFFTVWLFNWDGRFLKEFVHTGTWVLIFSILLSSIIALYFFKDNLNFYKNNKWLKRLTIVWILQNIFMTLSVGVRNYWYLTYFGLAYKRIAVFFFLILAIIGLITIIIKIIDKKSAFYLLRVNSYMVLIVLVISSIFNWNTIIAKYNFKNANKSFIEYKFMAFLDSSALPYTIKTMEELQQINTLQKKNMPFDINKEFYWTIETYYNEINLAKQDFITKYKNQKPLEWNLSDYLTYRKITKK
ncbi:MAG: DUF4153 domain-containing protein [Bacteroidales bacterium]|jgi:hypothetical protein